MIVELGYVQKSNKKNEPKGRRKGEQIFVWMEIRSWIVEFPLSSPTILLNGNSESKFHWTSGGIWRAKKM
jgi:hypothetical protein